MLYDELDFSMRGLYAKEPCISRESVFVSLISSSESYIVHQCPP